jgi:hypothetical protein
VKQEIRTNFRLENVIRRDYLVEIRHGWQGNYIKVDYKENDYVNVTSPNSTTRA